MEEYNVVICGVGGQGTILASKILAQTAVRLGLNARIGETHGMSQRGGTVISHVRMGSRVYGALTPEAHGDLMLAFEPVESLRYINYLKKDSYIILNSHPIIPTSVNAGLAIYPSFSEILSELKEITGNIVALNATEIARNSGSIISLNMVIIGAATKVPNFPLPKEELNKTIEELVKPRFLEINKKAFEAGTINV
jgi:indolepyruvate ferredoxin oxidoreductase beta subunit